MLRQTQQDGSTTFRLTPWTEVLAAAIFMVGAVLLLFVHTVAQVACDDRECTWWRESVLTETRPQTVARDAVEVFQLVQIPVAEDETPLVELVAVTRTDELILIESRVAGRETDEALEALERWRLTPQGPAVSLRLGFERSTVVWTSLFLFVCGLLYGYALGRSSTLTVSPSGDRLKVALWPGLGTRPRDVDLSLTARATVTKRGVFPQWSCLVIEDANRWPVELAKRIWYASSDMEEAAGALNEALARAEEDGAHADT